MKKNVVMLAIALIACGAVWAQAPTPGPAPARVDIFPEFNAVLGSSVESRYSDGMFTSDVDDYIDVSWFSGILNEGAEEGTTGKTTFLFAGGGVADLGTANGPAVSVGFGKTLGSSNNMYLGVYYGGSLVDAAGLRVKDDDVSVSASVAEWKNNLAVLFGIGKMGFRFDLTLNSEGAEGRVDGKLANQEITNAPTIGLSWGTNTGKLAPWVTLAFQFPDQWVTTQLDSDGKVDKKVTETQGATFGLYGGTWLELNDTSSIVASLAMGARFNDYSIRGDVDNYTRGTDPGTGTWSATDNGLDPYRSGGGFGAALYGHFEKTKAFGEEVTVKFLPNLNMGFLTLSNNSTIKDAPKNSSDNWFVFTPGINVGAEYKHDKIGVYTYVSLQFFEWIVYGHSGGDEELDGGAPNPGYDNSSLWVFNGLQWLKSKLAFGISFTPIKGLVFGVGIITPIVPDLATMTLGGGTTNPAIYNYSGYHNWFGVNSNGFTTPDASITVSYKF